MLIYFFFLKLPRIIGIMEKEFPAQTQSFMTDLLGIWNKLIITSNEPTDTSYKTQVTLTAFFSHKLKDYCLKVLTSEQNTIIVIFTIHPEGKWAAGASNPLTGAEINREKKKRYSQHHSGESQKAQISTWETEGFNYRVQDLFTQ